MSEEEKIQQIIRLKRHEKPRDGYFEDFLEEFQNRREQDAKPARAASGKWSLAAWIREKGTSGWVLGSGLAYAALVILIISWPRGPEAGRDESKQPVNYQPVPPQNPPIPSPQVPLPKREF